MLDSILRHFPADTHPLTLVSDPDNLLADEPLLAALAERGFTLIHEPDPIHLRHRLSQVHPPCIIVTAGPLNRLPYDLWQTGHPVTLAMHTFYPNLAYPLLQPLTPAQRARLASTPPPPTRLSPQATAEYLLQHVFELNLPRSEAPRPALLLDWLSRLHTRLGPLPDALTTPLLEKLSLLPEYTAWPLHALLTDPAAFTAFLNTHWRAYLSHQNSAIAFDQDHTFQDTLPRLIRERHLTPLEIPDPTGVPAWARAGILTPNADPRPARFATLLAELTDTLRLSPTAPATARWEDWQSLAWRWAELTALRYDPSLKLPPEAHNAYHSLQKSLDAAFTPWLQSRYTPLAGQRLPNPHHLFHVPHFLARELRQTPGKKIALLILDGLSLADWTLLRAAWHRQPWHFNERLLLAQVPSITAVSRQPLVSGLRPAEFAATMADNREEPRHWRIFWTAQGLPADASAYARLSLEKEPPASPPFPHHTQALCLINTALDEIFHSTLLGATEAQASLRLWLDTRAPTLEAFLNDLLAQNFTLYLTSDHGHTEARGIGQPSEGLLVQSRSKRARIYRDEPTARKIQSTYSQTYLWHGDGLLPDEIWALIPYARTAFAPEGEIFVTHGGLTLDEMIVPFVEITRPR